MHHKKNKMHSGNSPGPKQERLWCTFLPGVPLERKQTNKKLYFKPVRGSRAAFLKIQDSFHISSSNFAISASLFWWLTVRSTARLSIIRNCLENAGCIPNYNYPVTVIIFNLSQVALFHFTHSKRTIDNEKLSSILVL